MIKGTSHTLHSGLNASVSDYKVDSCTEVNTGNTSAFFQYF